MDASTVLPTPTAPQQPKLLDLLRQRIRVLHYSIRTEQAYVDWARRFILFHGKRHQLSCLQCCAASVAQRFCVGCARLQVRAPLFGLRV